MANQNRYVVAFGTFLVSPIDRSELFIVAFGGSFLDVVASGGARKFCVDTGLVLMSLVCCSMT